MDFIKKLFNYLLENPLYAVLIAVCYVAISVVVILLRAKASESGTKKNTQPVTVPKSVDAEIVATKSNAVTKEKSESEKVQKPKSVNSDKTSAEEKAKAVPVAEKKTATTNAKKETTVSKTEKVATAPASTAKKQSTTKATTTATTKKPSKASVATATAELPTEQTEKKGKGYSGKWIIWRLLTQADANHQEVEESYFFELLASNGEKLLSSEEYSSFAGAQKGIQTHKTNILKNNFRISLTKKGDYIFKLLNGKNTLLCTGENYPTKLRCESAIESTKRFAETAVIDENLHDLVIQLPPEDVEDNVIEVDNGYTGKWVIYSMVSPDDSPVYYFELFASNGEKLLTSEEYITYNGALNGITTHKNNIEKNNFRISLTKRGDYIFKLLNANDQLLCLGEHYKTRRRCENAVESVKRFAKNAQISNSPSVKKNISSQ